MKFLCFFLLLTLYSTQSHEKCDFPLQLEYSQNQKKNHVMSDLFAREDMQRVLITKSGKFAIHYDVSGFNAVSDKDLDNNSIPDYIDSAAYYIDAAYEDEVLGLGFPFFFKDNDLGGTEVYDIYIKEFINTPYYGGTQPENFISDPDGNKYYTSYIIIDNNFSVNDKKYRTTDIEGLKITIYHEFHHSIQIQMINNSLDAVIAEMTSTFMEYRFFPDVLDYVQWAKNWLAEPTEYSLTNETSPEKGYGLALFFQYTYKLYGDGLMLQLWRDLEKEVNKIDALNNMLITNNSNLNLAFCDFTQWMYSTGANSVGDKYFDHSVDLPEINLTEQIDYEKIQIKLQAKLKPFTFSPYRIIIDYGDLSSNDSLIVLLNNVDYENAKIGQSIQSEGKINVLPNDDGNSTKIEDLNLFYNDESDFVYCNNLFVLKGEEGVRYVESYPNPFQPKQHNSLFIPAPEGTNVYDYAFLEIYTSDMSVLLTTKKQVLVHQGQLVLTLNESELPTMTNGVYLFKSFLDENTKVGKILVKE